METPTPELRFRPLPERGQSQSCLRPHVLLRYTFREVFRGFDLVSALPRPTGADMAACFAMISVFIPRHGVSKGFKS